MLPAFGGGAAAAILALALLQHVGAESTSTSSVIHACASADGTLRLTEATVPCAPGDRRIRLRPREIAEERTCGEDDGRVAKLERRLKDLEYRDRSGTLRGRRVVAPFEVVTKDGRRLLYIKEETVQFYNTAGKDVVQIWADDDGGWLFTRSATASSSVGIGVPDQRAHVVVKEKDRDRIDLGRSKEGRYSLRVFEPGGKMVAGIGQSELGSGLAVIAGTDGSSKATIFLPFAVAGQVKVSNSKGTEVAFLTTSGGGSGQLQLTDGSGTPMVEAGVTKDGLGVVRTGPGMYHSGVGILGLVPSFIIGKAK